MTMKNFKYYIGSGRSNQMYTLRYSFDQQLVCGGHIENRHYDYYVCTLAKYRDRAIQKAINYVVERGYAADEFDFETHIELDELEGRIGRNYAQEVAQKIMIEGCKYAGMKVEDVPVEYLKWSYANTHIGVNSKIIRNYVDEFNLLDGWYNEASLNVYKFIKEVREKIIANIENRTIVLGNREYKQGRMTEKNFEYLRHITLVNKHKFKSFLEKNLEAECWDVDLVKLITEHGMNSFNNDLNNYLVAFHLCATYKTNKPINILDIDFDYVVECFKSNPNAIRLIMIK